MLPISNLLHQISQKVQLATKSGELKTIHTDKHILKDIGGLEYVVQVKKPTATVSKPMNLNGLTANDVPLFDPFMPPYPTDLHLSTWKNNRYPEFALILNKYNVMKNHILIVTTHFESQFSPLNGKCLSVMHEVIKETDGFGFYNAGVEAGPSQPHRHMQVVPREGNIMPFYDIITEHAKNTGNQNPFSINLFNFEHSVCKIPEKENMDTQMLEWYNSCLSHVSLPIPHSEDETVQPHNVLMGHNWIMVVPRTVAEYEEIPGNGLCFIGSFLVKNQEIFDRLKQIGPMNVMVQLGKPRL